MQPGLGRFGLTGLGFILFYFRRMLSISQIFLHIYSIQWCLLLGYSQTLLQLRYMEDIVNS